jgi:uncharacterized protein YbcI
VTIEPTSGLLSLLPRGGLAPIEETDKDGSMKSHAVGDDGLPGGELNAAISNELGKMVAEFVGRGATRSRVFIGQDIVVCLLEDGATKGEQNLAAAGRADLVRLGRDILQRSMEERLVGTVERLTRRKVRLFLSGMSTPGDSAVEVFVLEPDHPSNRTDAPDGGSPGTR